MSDFDGGFDSDHGTDYGHVETGQEHEGLDQLHQAHGAEADLHNQFGQYEADHNAAEHTGFQQGHHTESDVHDAHNEADDYTNYDHDAAENDHVFAAAGETDAHQAEFGELDALQHQFDAQFASGTELHTDGAHAGFNLHSN